MCHVYPAEAFLFSSVAKYTGYVWILKSIPHTDWITVKPLIKIDTLDVKEVFNAPF